MWKFVKDFFCVFVSQAALYFCFHEYFREGRFWFFIPFCVVMYILFSFAGRRGEICDELSHVRIILRNMALELLMLIYLGEIFLLVFLDKGL